MIYTSTESWQSNRYTLIVAGSQVLLLDESNSLLNQHIENKYYRDFDNKQMYLPALIGDLTAPLDKSLGKLKKYGAYSNSNQDDDFLDPYICF